MTRVDSKAETCPIERENFMSNTLYHNIVGNVQRTLHTSHYREYVLRPQIPQTGEKCVHLQTSLARLGCCMAMLDGNLWDFNMAKVLVVDVSDDYRLLQPPLPTECYPVLAEMWMPLLSLNSDIAGLPLVEGYLYDWHQEPQDQGTWVVGVVDQAILRPDQANSTMQPARD